MHGSPEHGGHWRPDLGNEYDQHESSPGQRTEISKSIQSAYPAMAAAAVVIGGGLLLLVGGPIALLAGAALAYGAYKAGGLMRDIKHESRRQEQEVHDEDEEYEGCENSNDVNTIPVGPTTNPPQTFLHNPIAPHSSMPAAASVDRPPANGISAASSTA